MAERKHLIDADDFQDLARPVSIHLDEAEVDAYIAECEDIYIIPAIGYGNFAKAVNSETFDDTFDDTFSASIWLDGGEFDAPTDNCGCKGVEKSWCVGLRKTLAYYVYARMGRADGSIIARSGYMRHEDTYANHVPTEQKQYDDVMDVAEKYLAGCMKYAQIHSADCKKVQPVRGSRAAIKVIGD